jgi:ATP-dependent DNA helicase RecQ
MGVSAAELERGLGRLGYAGFRPGQREAVETLLAHRRLLLVAPTGGGKSLVYQLAACVLPGTTLVISPLIALMQDQVQALSARGVAATYLASTLAPGESARRLREIGSGACKIAYVAPERLVQESFRALLRALDCPLVAVDEAHCISEWGHDFRPEYREIRQVLAGQGDVRVLACTATATPLVRDEILLELGLPPDTPQIVRGFDRPSLILRAAEVTSAAERRARVDELLREALGSPLESRGAAIVYAPTRRASEAEAARLAAHGWRADAYHAGLPAARRDDVQARFAARALDVVAATTAFGMGIDRADVRAVVHLAPPSSIEAYYQEVGRAGRDGAPAFGLLIHAPEDAPRRRSLLERGDGETPVDPRVVEHKWELFLELLRFAQGGSCRAHAILRYFGEPPGRPEGCGRCDECGRLDAGEADDPAAVSLVVRKALSGVARLRGRYGLRTAIALVRGVPDARLERAGLDRLSTFGVLEDASEAWLLRLYQRMVTAGWVSFAGGERPVVALTEEGHEVMVGRRPARLVLPPAAPGGGGARAPRDARAVPAVPAAGTPAWGPESEARFQALRACRQRLARAAGVPPYVVAHDRTLRDIAALNPRTDDALAVAHGMGPARIARFGAAFLEALRAAG